MGVDEAGEGEGAVEVERGGGGVRGGGRGGFAGRSERGVGDVLAGSGLIGANSP